MNVSVPASALIDGRDGGAIDFARGTYSRTAVVLHWLIGIALLAEVVFGLYLRELAKGSPLRGPAVNLHKSIGLVVGVAILVRLVWRFTHRPPSLPSDVPRWQVLAARANHTAMYVCMIVIPLAGYIASNFSKYGIKFFNRWVLPPWGPDSPAIYTAFNNLHDIAAYVLMALVVIHVAATLKHAWIDRDRPFARLSLRRH